MNMKRIIVCVVMMLISLTVFAQEKVKIAVYMTGNDPINEIASNRLMSDLISSGKYKPIERSADFLAAISKEQSYERSGEVDDDQIAALGKQFGLQYVIVVSVIGVWSNEKYITAHIIDVNSAVVTGSCNTFGVLDSPSDLMAALDDLSMNLKDVLGKDKGEELPKVAVYVTRTGNRDVDVVLGDQLVTSFSESGAYIAVERSNAILKQLQKETNYQYSGAVDDNQRMAELGKQFGVQFVCVAKTINWGGVYFITARLVNVETAEAIKICNIENKTIQNTFDVIATAQDICDVFEDYGEEIQEDLMNKGIFNVVESDPKFPGGMAALYRFLAQNIKYPQLARDNGITGKVYVTFVVERDGSIANPKVIKDIGGGCGQEAIRVVKMMPRWKPGRQRGKRVRVQYSLPINFNLN